MNALSVEKLLGGPPILSSTREFILERNLISVMNVQEPSWINLSCFSTRKFTLERNLINVMSVGKHSASILNLSYTREFTLERSLTSAKNVRRPLVGALTSSDIKVFTVWIDLQNRKAFCGKAEVRLIHNLHPNFSDQLNGQNLLCSGFNLNIWSNSMRHFYELFI